MIRKRSWLGVLGIPLGLAVVVLMGANPQRPAQTRGVIDPSCTSSGPCIQYNNSGTGAAIKGLSSGGPGMIGTTSFNSTSTSNGRAGLVGIDSSTSGVFNSGVRGLSVRGIGVKGQTTSGTGIEGEATSSSGTAVLAIGATRIDGTASDAAALSVDSDTNDAIFAGSLGQAISAFNHSFSADTAFFANTEETGGEAGIGTAFGVGVAAFGGDLPGGTVPALNATCFGAPAITATSGNGPVDIMSLDCSGNMILAGTLTTSGTPLAIRRSAVGSALGTYSAQQTTQTIEDFGEGQLVAGYAYVRLAADFAATIDSRVNYLVFITPQGDSRGLYVTHKSAAGFAVRESSNGRSSLAFDYRIVARPFGELSRRLPAMQAKLRTAPSVAKAIRRAIQAKAQAAPLLARIREQALHHAKKIY